MSPKNGMQGMVVGAITLRLIAALPEKEVGWLVKAWLAYRQEGTEPEEVPTECLGSWIAIHEETQNMMRLSQIRRDAGNIGNERKRSQALAKASQTDANGTQTVAEENKKRREENTQPSGCVYTPTREEQLPQGLADAMADAPISPVDALDYAKGPQCGLTEEQVMAWANWNAERGWMRSVGGSAVRKMDRRGAESSLRSWRTKQAEFDAIKRGQDKQQGNIKGVRIAGDEEIVKKKLGF